MRVLGAWTQLRRLQRRTRFSAGELAVLQGAKLRRLLDHAGTTVPYYRRLLQEAGLSPQDIHSPEDLHRLPVTRRSDILGVPLEDRLTAGIDLRPLIHHHTSGSTGVQLELCYSPEEHQLHSLLTLRSQLAVGLGLVGHVAMICRPAAPRRDRWYQRIGLLRRSIVDMWAPYDSQLEAIRELRPDALVAFPFHLRLLAATVRETGSDGLTAPLIFTNSERLTDETRRLVEEVFNGRVFEHYDAWEAYLIAWECVRRDGLHIDADHVLIECLDRDGEPCDGPGELVITNLDLYTTPVIRYALDDVVTLDHAPCSCGCSFPRIARVEGRTADLFHLPGGRRLSPLAFPDLPHVLQYRAVQEAIDRVRVEIVPSSDFRAATQERLRSELATLLGPDVGLRIVHVDRIPVTAAGKTCFLISEVDGSSAVSD